MKGWLWFYICINDLAVFQVEGKQLQHGKSLMLIVCSLATGAGDSAADGCDGSVFLVCGVCAATVCHHLFCPAVGAHPVPGSVLWSAAGEGNATQSSGVCWC